MSERTRVVEIPEETAAVIAGRLAGTEFESVDDYVAFVLAELLEEVDDDPDGPDGADADHDDVQSRLESLGYL